MHHTQHGTNKSPYLISHCSNRIHLPPDFKNSNLHWSHPNPNIEQKGPFWPLLRDS